MSAKLDVSRWVRKKCWIGLDLGTSAFKLVEVALRASGPRITRAALQSWSSDPASRGQQLRAALEAFGARQVHMGLSGPDVVIRRVQLPQLEAHEISEAVRWQIKDYLAYPPQEACVATQVVEQAKKKGAATIEVLACVASKSAIDARISGVQAAGQTPASLSPNIVALCQGVQALYPGAGSTTAIAVMDIGATQTHLAITAGGQVRVVRDLSVGGDTLSQALVSTVSSEHGEISIDGALAETLKRRYGVVAPDEDGLSEEGIPLRHLSALMRPVLESVTTEVRRFLDFYRMQMDEQGVSQLYLCGGTASIKGLAEALSESLDIGVTCVDPLAFTEGAFVAGVASPETEGPQLAVAFGLAVDHGQSFNLIGRPSTEGELPAVPEWMLRLGLAFAAVALVALAGLGLAYWQARHAQRSLEARWAQVEPMYSEYQRLSREERKLASLLSTAESLRRNRPLWDGILKELATVMPAEIRLTTLNADRLSMEGASSSIRLRLEGQADMGASGSQAALVAFVEALEGSIFFSRVDLVRSERPADREQGVQFGIECQLE